MLSSRSFQQLIKASVPAVARAERHMGRTMRRNICNLEHPSIVAASSNSIGICFIKAVIIKIDKEEFKTTNTIIRLSLVPIRFMRFIRTFSGIMTEWMGTMSPKEKNRYK